MYPVVLFVMIFHIWCTYSQEYPLYSEALSGCQEVLGLKTRVYPSVNRRVIVPEKYG